MPSKTLDRDDVIESFKRELSDFYGYDENLKYVGAPKSLLPTEAKAFLEPRDFLNFAVEDAVALERERNRVNCLGNCKRAIDAQVDRLIKRLGYWRLARKQGWNVPKKLNFISDSGVVGPRILRNVNILRNRLEHEFSPPSKEQVEDALDVATLFVSYAELIRIPTMNLTLASKLSVRYNYEEMVFDFYEADPSDLPEDEVLPSCSLAYGDKGFESFYDFLVKVVPLMERKRDLPGGAP